MGDIFFQCDKEKITLCFYQLYFILNSLHLIVLGKFSVLHTKFWDVLTFAFFLYLLDVSLSLHLFLRELEGGKE